MAGRPEASRAAYKGHPELGREPAARRQRAISRDRGRLTPVRTKRGPAGSIRDGLQVKTPKEPTNGRTQGGLLAKMQEAVHRRVPWIHMRTLDRTRPQRALVSTLTSNANSRLSPITTRVPQAKCTQERQPLGTKTNTISTVHQRNCTLESHRPSTTTSSACRMVRSTPGTRVTCIRPKPSCITTSAPESQKEPSSSALTSSSPSTAAAP